MKNIIKNLFENLPTPSIGNEIFTTLLEHKNVKIERIHSNKIENGQWYMQAQDEWVVLLHGKASLEIEGQTFILQSGDSIFIEKNKKHRVLFTDEKTLWLGIHIF